MKFTKKLLKKFISGNEAKWGKITYSKAIKQYAGKDIKKLSPEEMDEVFKMELADVSELGKEADRDSGKQRKRKANFRWNRKCV